MNDLAESFIRTSSGYVEHTTIPPDGPTRPPPSGCGPRAGIEVSAREACQKRFEARSVEMSQEMTGRVPFEIERRAEELVGADEEVRGSLYAAPTALVVVTPHRVTGLP